MPSEGAIGGSCQGREAQLGLALQTFWARVKVAVRGDKRRHLQEIWIARLRAADKWQR